MANVTVISKDFVEQNVQAACNDLGLISDKFMFKSEYLTIYKYWTDLSSKAVSVLSYFHRNDPEWLEDSEEGEILTDEAKAKELWDEITDDKICRIMAETISIAHDFLGEDVADRIREDFEFFRIS